MNSVKLQDVRLIYRSLLLFYIVIMNYQKQRETRKQSHLQLHPKEWNREFPGGTVVRINLQGWIHLQGWMQGTQVQSLVQEDSTHQRATMAMHHIYRACTRACEPHYWVCLPPLLKTRCPRAHPPQGKPLKWEALKLRLESRTRESPPSATVFISTKTKHCQQINI